MFSFLFVHERKRLVTKSSFEEFNNSFLPGEAQDVLFWNSTKAAKFLKTLQVHFLLYGQENYVFKWEFM